MLDRVRALLGRPAPPRVTVLRLSGTIAAPGGPLRGGGISIAGMAGPIERAFAPRGLSAVALVINSPGGSPVQASLVAKRIRDLAEEKKLPVFTFIEDLAASGGYWLACAGDEIFADTSSVVGSIGVITANFGFHELIRRWGIERRVHTAGPHKSTLDPFRPEDPDDVARLKALQSDVHEAFADHVRTRRAGRLKADEATLFTGEFWTGRRALELGLVDGLGDLRGVLRARFGDTVKLLPVAQERSWLARRLRGNTRYGDLGGEAVRAAVDAMEERALWARYGQ